MPDRSPDAVVLPEPLINALNRYDAAWIQELEWAKVDDGESLELREARASLREAIAGEIERVLHMVEIRDRVIDKQREDFEWLEAEGIDILTRNRDSYGIEDDRIVLWGDRAEENRIFPTLQEAIAAGRLSQLPGTRIRGKEK